MSLQFSYFIKIKDFFFLMEKVSIKIKLCRNKKNVLLCKTISLCFNSNLIDGLGKSTMTIIHYGQINLKLVLCSGHTIQQIQAISRKSLQASGKIILCTKCKVESFEGQP